MALLNPTFFVGLLVLLYLSSFVFFAVLRIVTGISIQRIGYLSLRRLAYTPRDGCHVEIRGLGLNFHRPTFAQPTWLSLTLNELVVTIDIRALERSAAAQSGPDEQCGNEQEGATQKLASLSRRRHRRHASQTGRRSETWKQLTDIKEKIKKLHRKLNWLSMIDVVATNSAVNVVDVGNIQVGSFTIAVDTRRKMVDRTRFFFRKSASRKQERQAEWIMTLRSVLFTADGKDSLEILDHALINVHGFLYQWKDGLREATIAMKFGRFQIPYDDIALCAKRLRQQRRESKDDSTEEVEEIYIGDVFQEFGKPGSTSEDLMRTVSDSKEFFSSILRGIKEVQFAISFIGLTKNIHDIKPTEAPLHMTAAMKEVGIDFHRLDSKSPAHRMYFPSNDIAHEALAAALSISIGLDYGSGKPERLVYIPMATTTVRTTLPSKTVEFGRDVEAEDKNANILYANSVVTSPSIDLDPRHLPLVIALLEAKPKPAKTSRGGHHHSLISRLLPKANVKFSMHEPVLRIKLKPLHKTKDPDDFDLIISSISSISVDMESSHSTVQHLHYSIDASMRLQSHHLYYQTNASEIFNLTTTESCDLRMHLAATPDVTADITGNIQSFAISMVRPEITDGLRQIVRELRIEVESERRSPSSVDRNGNFLRSMPEWLFRFQIEVNDLNIEVAGVDEDISNDTRGVSLHLDKMSAEYRAHRLEGLQRRLPTRRTHSRSITQSDSDLTPSPASPKARKLRNRGDGGRLTFTVQGMDAQIVEAADRVETEPFINVPMLELAVSVSSDAHGPMLHVQSYLRSIYVQYSLCRHYAVGVAVMTLRKAFMRTGKDMPRPRRQGPLREQSLAPPAAPTSSALAEDSIANLELITVDIKMALLQVKAELPQEPPLMLHIFGLEAGQHRWSTPYLSSRLIRLYTQPPRLLNTWAKLVSIKSGRLDLRESKKKTAVGGLVPERLIDITSQAVRVAVPHEVIIHRISDNCINVLKAVQQLHHRFKTGTNEYILEQKPEPPKNVPRMSIRTRSFLFEIEDGAFEWKLGMIYHTGRIEQMQRLAREEAFKVKMKRVREEESRRGGSKVRSRSAFARGRPERSGAGWFRSRSLDGVQPEDTLSGLARGRIPRYDPEKESLGINGYAKVSEEEARLHLDMYNAQTWKKRIDCACKRSQEYMKEYRETFWGTNHLPDDVEETENVLEVPQRPALMSVIVSDLRVVVDKPTFALEELPDFLNRVGKGMPRDMTYTLLLPMHVAIEMDEVRVSLRDYPLPVLHIPDLKAGQSARVPSVSLKTNFVLAEEYRGPESTRRVRVDVIPPKSGDPANSNDGRFAIDVRRSVGAVKSFSDVYMDINTALPTRMTWGPCYQPAIQDLMMVCESFTKPQVDPSERAGFWDKLRLICHSRIHVAWKGDGDMHLALKGTKDPYQITGNGAGFLMCWRKDIRWNIHVEDDPKRFMTVDSGEYLLAIPDYSRQVRDNARRRADGDGQVQEEGTQSGAAFKKVIMKLSGNVQWVAGLVFEQAIDGDGNRNFSFRPHYDVVLKTPSFAKSGDGLPYDALRGFRSRHIHLSIGVRAPVNRDWMSGDPGISKSYNTVHLTPRFFTHFFAWWDLFSQPISLPIRQGNLFPGREKNSKKFGRHLGTVKYNLLLAPLFLSHIYKHKDVDDYTENGASATGLKVRFDSFMLDLHQRREAFQSLAKNRPATSRTSRMKIHTAQLDLVNADLRAVSASLKGSTTEAIKSGSVSNLIADQDEKPDLSRFIIPDNDLSWIDMDDFVELDWVLATEPHPDAKILPLAFAPRLTYFRQTDIGGVVAGDPTRTSPFGNEPTHSCIMTHDDDPRKVQTQLVKGRLEQLVGQMHAHTRNVGEAELRLVQCDPKDPDAVEDCDTLRRHTHVLRDKKQALEKMLEQMQTRTPPGGAEPTSDRKKESQERVLIQDETLHIPTATEFESDFKSRFVIHNLHLKWNNVLRNIVLRYIHQNSQRRGFIYYLSRPAVKFILDIVEEQNRAKEAKASKQGNSSPSAGTSSDSSNKEKESGNDMGHRLRSILGDGCKFNSTVAFDCNGGEASCERGIEDLGLGIGDEFSPESSYHVRLIAPQIQLQSDKNKKHVVLVTAKGMELKVVEVMDKERILDNVSGLVQRRFLVNMDSTQFFVAHKKWFLTSLVSTYAGNCYGTPSGSSWPPWVPMEVMFDFEADPFGFKRVVQKTSAMLRYDKYNTLRLKFNDEVNAEGTKITSLERSENRMDNLWVEFPSARALCNSSQYYTMYVIVLDLLMYSEPLEKTRSERLEKIMLASDFSDLSGAPEMVMRLQERVTQLEEIKSHFQIWAKYLDKKGWEDRLSLERDLAACEDELFFMMKAITTSQRKFELNSDNNALLRWSISARDIVWHLMQDSNEALVELQLKDVEYDRTDHVDGSHMNLFRVGKVLGLNLLPDATYPEIIAPYHESDKTTSSVLDAKSTHQSSKDKEMVRVYWYMLEAIAGIPVMERFEFDLFPMKIQLERDVGKRLFEYIFPGMDGDKFGTGKKDDSPFLLRPDQNEDDEDSPASSSSRLGTAPVDKGGASFSTRPGSLELRLRPTLSSNPPKDPRNPRKTIGMHSGEGHSFRLFRSSGTGKSSLGKKSSRDSLRSNGTTKLGSTSRSNTGSSVKDGRELSDSKRASRFALRNNKAQSDDKQHSDDLTKMIDRASNYMTFAYIRMPSVVLCLSYKGKEQRNFEDLHDFVFRLPTIEWQNKTWSNLDLALALKKAVMKALISHTGAIIGNKFSKHRPNAEQRNRLRELANSSALIAPSANGSREYAGSVNDSDDSSLYSHSPIDYSRSPPRSIRGSTHGSIRPRSTDRSSSIASSHRSLQGGASGRHLPDVPPQLTMTPASAFEGSGRRDTAMAETQRSRPRTSSTGPERPGTSASGLDVGDRRRNGIGLRDKLSALTAKAKLNHRESSGAATASKEEDAEGEEDREGKAPSRRMSWAPGRSKS